MAFARCTLLAIVSLFLLLTGIIHSEESKPPRTDLYGDPLPPGAVARLGTIRLRHERADVAFSKDGKQLISGGCDGELRVWDVATGRLLRRKQLARKPRKPREGKRLQMGLSVDGAIAAVASSEMVYLYDTATGKEYRRFPIRAYCDKLLLFSPDGKSLVVQEGSAQDFFVTHLWDIAGVKKRQTLEEDSRGSGNRLTNIAFAPDGKRLAGANVEGELFLWDTATGKVLAKKKEKLAPLEDLPVAFSPDGKTLACASRLKVRLLNAVTLKERAHLEVPADVKDGQIGRLAFSPDGRVLGGTYISRPRPPSESGVFLWSVPGAKEMRRLPARIRYGDRLKFAPDSKTLASHNEFGSEIQLWDVVAGRPLHQRPGHDQTVAVLSASPDGKVIASGDFGGVLRLWDAATSRQLQALEGQSLPLTACLFSPDDKRMISTEYGFPSNIVFQVWNVATGKPLRRFEFKGKDFWPSVHAAAVSADGKRLAAVVSLEKNKSEALLVVWDLATGRRLSQRPYRYEAAPDSDRYPPEAAAYVAFAPDGESIGVLRDGKVGFEEVATGALLATLPKGIGQRGRPLVFSPDGRLAAANWRTKEYTPRIALIETASGEEVMRLEPEQCGAVAFTSDGRGIIVVDSERLSVWDTDTGNKLYERALPQGLDDRAGVVALPGGRAATAMTEGDILVWDLAPASWPLRKPERELDREKLNALWSELAADARRAYRAMYKLTDAPAQTVPFLKERLQPVALDTRRIEKQLAELDSDLFETREAAFRELVRMRYRVDLLLRRALENKPSLEKRRRLESILAEPKRPPAEALRTPRAIAVLERIATPEAQRILEKLAGGAASPETREARAALRRLNQRDASAKGRSAP